MSKSKKFSLAIFGILFLMQLPHFFLPITGGHKWRQADTWAIAKNFALEDANFFFPRVDVRGDKSGIDAAETPFYPYFVSLFFRLFKTTHPFWGKFISFLSGMGLIYILGKWISQNLKIEAYLAYFIVGCVQIIFSYSHSFMPEVFSLFFSVLGSYFLFLDYQNKKTLYLLLGWFFLTIGITARPMQIFWGISYLYLIYLSFKERKTFAWRYFLFGFFSLAFFAFWYFYWSEYLRKEYELKYFARFVDEFSLKNFSIFLNLEIYLQTLKHLVGANSPLIFILSSAGFYLWLKNKSFQKKLSFLLLEIFFLTWFAMLLVSQRHFINHNYYLISLQPALAYFATISFSQLWQKKEKWGLAYGIGILVAIFLNNFHEYHIPKEYYLLKEIKKELEPNLELPIAIESVDYAYGLYVLEKRGFVLYPEEIRKIEVVESLLQKKVKYFIVKENQKFSLYKENEWLKKLKNSGNS